MSCHHLLEHLAVGPFIRLAVHHNRLVPGPLVVDKLLVLLLLGIELGEGVALIVGSNIERCESILATDKECTLDDGVVGHAINRRSAEDVLAASLKAGEETT